MTPTPAPPGPGARTDVAIAGGGVIGLVCAWRLAQRGLSVLLCERDALGAGASDVAAGMLAPVTEADAGERALLAAGLASARAWPAFAAELEAASEREIGFRACGTLVVARDADELEWLEREQALRDELGLPVERLRGREARSVEPALAPGVRAALRVAGDHAVDPRALVAALVAACRRAGAELREHCEVAATDPAGLTLAAGERVAAGAVIVATGAWSGAPVRPVKGQILRLRDPEGPGLVASVLRFRAYAGGSGGGYLVPRGDGRYVLGATMEERGFDTTVTAGGVRELLQDGRRLVPGLDELVLEEVRAGLRPGTPDGAPVIGEADGVIRAVGHHRNGILLTPFTGDAVAALVAGEPPPKGVAAFAPERFEAAVR